MYRLTPTATQMQAVSVVAESAVLVDVRLVRVQAETTLDLQLVKGKLLTDLSFGLDGYRASGDGRLLVDVHMNLTASSSERAPEGASVPAANVEIRLQAEYRIPDGPIPEHIEKQGFPAFAEFNGLFNCWPYFRNHLQTMTASMGLPAFVLAPLTVRVTTPEVTAGGASKPAGETAKKRVASVTRGQRHKGT